MLFNGEPEAKLFGGQPKALPPLFCLETSRGNSPRVWHD